MANKNVAVNEDVLEDIADAIRDKAGTTTEYSPLQFNDMVNKIINPSGNINVNTTSSTNVTNYATAKINDANLVTGNIKSGVTILGISGKSSVVDTADANAAAANIKKGKTAYINGSKVTGTGEIYVDGTTLYIPSTGWVN